MVERFHIVFATSPILQWKAPPWTSKQESRGRFLFRCRRRPRRRRRFRRSTRRRRRGRRRLSGPGRDFPRGDHRDPLDEHPVSRHSDELDSVVQQDRGTELELVCGQEGFARFRREDVHLPLRMIGQEALHDLRHAPFLIALYGGDEGDRYHGLPPAYRSDAHKGCARATRGKTLAAQSFSQPCGPSWPRRRTRRAAISATPSSPSHRGSRTGRSVGRHRGGGGTPDWSRFRSTTCTGTTSIATSKMRLDNLWISSSTCRSTSRKVAGRASRFSRS